MKKKLINKVQKDFFAAVIKTDLQTIRGLLKQGAEINAFNTDGYTALMIAIQTHSYEMMELLISAGANVNAVCEKESFWNTPLLIAFSVGDDFNPDPKVVSLLLSAGADPNLHAKGSLTPLMWAAGYSPNNVKALLSAGADVNITPVPVSELSGGGQSALLVATACNQTEVIKEFILLGADVNFIGGLYLDTPLIYACNHNNVEIVQILLNAGAASSINVQTEDTDCKGYTALMSAVRNNNVEIVQMLLNAGADVTLKTERGKTALNIAQNALQVFQLLQNAGAKLK